MILDYQFTTFISVAVFILHRLMNLTENSILFASWFYENGVGTDVDIFRPPYGMTNLRTDKNDNGDMLIYFQNGYSNYRETNFVVREK